MSLDPTRQGWLLTLRDDRPRRRPQLPSIIRPGFGGYRAFPDLAALAADLAQLLAGRRPVLTRSFATYPGFDTFPAFSVNAEGDQGESPARAATYLCAIAVQGFSAESIEQAIAEAGQRRAAA